MSSISKTWRGVLSGIVLMGLVGVLRGPQSARAEEPEPPLDTYDANWTGGSSGLAIGSAVVPNLNPPPATNYYEAADDLVLPGGATYGLVTNVNVDGEFLAGSNLSSVTVRFYSNTSNLPGNLLYNRTATITNGGTSGDFQLTLPSSAALRTNQTYWLSVQAQISNSDGNWFWTTRTPQTGNPASLRKSSEGVCQNVWTSLPSCESSIIFGPDLYFQLTYTPFTPTEFLYLPLIGK